jgi:hypothetical protein
MMAVYDWNLSRIKINVTVTILWCIVYVYSYIDEILQHLFIYLFCSVLLFGLCSLYIEFEGVKFYFRLQYIHSLN